MNRINLIPAHRVESASRRRRVRLWIGMNAIAVALVLSSWGLVTMANPVGDPVLAETLGNLESQIAAVDVEIEDVRHKLSLAQSEVAAANAVGLKPDWSRLMRLISKTLGPDVVLSSCSLKARIPPAARATATSQDSGAKPADGYQLELAGVGQSQTAVSTFALDLEKTKLFDDVKLIETQRQKFLNSDAVTFRLICGLGAHEESSP